MAKDIKDNNIDDILSSILDKSSEDNKSANREGVISDPDDYSEVLKSYSNKSVGNNDADEQIEDLNEFADKTIMMSGTTGVFNPDAIMRTPPVKAEKTERFKKAKKKKAPRRNYSAYGGIVLATIVVCCSIIISLFGIVVGRDFLGIDGQTNEFTVYIPEGSTVDDIANILYNEGVISYVEFFKVFAKVVNSGDMYPGDLEITKNMSYSDLIDSLTQMREAKATVTVTLVEGITLYDAALKLEEMGVCKADDFIFTFNSTSFGYEFEQYVESSPLKFYKYEGYMFPDTYEFYIGDTTYNIVRRIKQRTNEILNSEVIQQAKSMGYTLDEVVALASIVQRECGDPEEMKNVASVFLNRLANPEVYPKLQSDTTYSYIENVIKKLSTIEYTDMYDAYDTYTCTGIPIGAICNPGVDAINAVLYANETNYYYFCSNLETREMFYAETYEQHKDNLKLAGLEE